MYHETKELITATPKTSKYHEFAELIRRGCKMAPRQAFGRYFEGRDAACAIGAAILGAGMPVERNTDFWLTVEESSFDSFISRFIGGQYLHDLIVRMNDKRKLSREVIADWLDTL
ncbi:MAG TPA: hypothetical protein VNF29_15570 [Candidatus Binataceae bacterium]|nr:hypothetical protein [Candidatus Binataceae bacterium]